MFDTGLHGSLRPQKPKQYADVAAHAVLSLPRGKASVSRVLAVLVVFISFVVLGGGFLQWRLLRDGRSEQENTNFHMYDNSLGAICLLGSARDFELTGPSIEKYLLSTFRNNSDIFIIAVMDNTVHKLRILKSLKSYINFVKLRIVTQFPIWETEKRRDVLEQNGSPNGIQGLLQYFNLVEDCLEMVESHEKKTKKVFSWILRTRLDAFWNDFPPPFGLTPNTYFVPFGSKFFGYNDRFGIGLMNESRVALSRFSFLEKLEEYGYKGVNSEGAFATQLASKKIRVVEKNLNFCILSRREYPFPSYPMGVPTISISSKGAGNGAKCRPCKTKLEERISQLFINNLEKKFGWPGPSLDLELCEENTSWEPSVYDDLVGKKWAKLRKGIVDSSFEKCKSSFQNFLSSTNVSYQGPPPAVICQVARFDSPNQSFGLPIYVSFLHENSVVYSVHNGNYNESFELERIQSQSFRSEKMIHEFVGCTIHIFSHVALDYRNVEKKGGLEFHTWISENSFSLDLYAEVELFRPIDEVHLSTKTLKNTMVNLTHHRIDLFIVSFENNHFSVPLVDWSREFEKLPICQLVVKFIGKTESTKYNKVVEKASNLLKKIGFYVVYCSGMFGEESCIYFREDACRTSNFVPKTLDV